MATHSVILAWRIPWTEVCNILQEAAKTISKRSKKAKWLSEEILQITEEWSKKQGEKEKYIQLNSFKEFLEETRRPFFNEQCIIIEENSKSIKTRNLFRKIGNIKGTFHPKMGTIKDQNEMERIHRRTVYKKILMNWITTMVWIVTQSQTFWSVKSSEP